MEDWGFSMPAHPVYLGLSGVFPYNRQYSPPELCDGRIANANTNTAGAWLTTCRDTSNHLVSSTQHLRMCHPNPAQSLPDIALES